MLLHIHKCPRNKSCIFNRYKVISVKERVIVPIVYSPKQVNTVLFVLENGPISKVYKPELLE